MSASDPQIAANALKAANFVQSWKPDASPEVTEADHAFLIAVFDTRDCSFGDKFIDAMAFLQSRHAAQ